MRNRTFVPYRNRLISTGFEDERLHRIRTIMWLFPIGICCFRNNIRHHFCDISRKSKKVARVLPYGYDSCWLSSEHSPRRAFLLKNLDFRPTTTNQVERDPCVGRRWCRKPQMPMGIHSSEGKLHRPGMDTWRMRLQTWVWRRMRCR